MQTQLKQQQGVGMLEVLITVVILSIGLLGVAATQSIAVKETGSSSQRTAAMFLINDLVERMHANPSAFTTYKQTVGVCGAEPKKCDNTNATAATACSTDDLAAYDAYQVTCPQSGTTKYSNINYLALDSITLECESGNCAAPNGKAGTFSVEVKWTESTNDKKISGTNKGTIKVKAAL